MNTFTFYLAAARKEKTAKRKKEKVFALAGAMQTDKEGGRHVAVGRKGGGENS